MSTAGSVRSGTGAPYTPGSGPITGPPPGEPHASRQRVKLFRWRGIIPLVLGLGLAALWWALFGAHTVKTTLEEAGTKALGTELDIARLRVLVPRSAVELHDIAVADPFDSGRNLVEAKLVRVELDPEALLERKLVVRRLTIGDVRTGTHRLTPARSVAGGGFAPRALLELQRWAKQFDVPLLSLTPIDTIKALVLDPTQLRTVQSALALARRADSVQAALTGGFASLRIPETLDSARALATRLQGANVRTLGITGVRTAIGDLRRNIARLDSTRARVQALQTTTVAGLDSLQHGVAALDDARRADYAFARGLLKLPTVDAPNIGAALFGKVTIDKVQQALYWTDLARQYAPPGLLPREEPGPKRLRMAGSTIHFVKQRSYPRFLLQRGDVDLTVSDGPARGRYTLAIADATTEPALVGRPTRFALHRVATGSALDSLRVVGAIDHTQSRPREVLTVNAAGLALPGIPFPSLPYHLEPGRGTSTLQLSLDGDQLSARWTMSSTDVGWLPDSTRVRRLGTIESLVAQVLIGIHRIDLAAEMHGPARSPTMSVRSNLDQAIADRLRTVAGEQIASAEAKMRAQVDRIVDAKTAPVKARVAALRAEAEQRVAEARKQLDAEKGRLDQELQVVGRGLIP